MGTSVVYIQSTEFDLAAKCILQHAMLKKVFKLPHLYKPCESGIDCRERPFQTHPCHCRLWLAS